MANWIGAQELFIDSRLSNTIGGYMLLTFKSQSNLLFFNKGPCVKGLTHAWNLTHTFASFRHKFLPRHKSWGENSSILIVHVSIFDARHYWNQTTQPEQMINNKNICIFLEIVIFNVQYFLWRIQSRISLYPKKFLIPVSILCFLKLFHK